MAVPLLRALRASRPDAEITLVEYGNAAISTKLIRSTSFVPFDPVLANVIAFNAGQSLDAIAKNAH